MAVLAQGLPVFYVPEKLLIAAMRDDVADHRRGGKFTVKTGKQKVLQHIAKAPVCLAYFCL